MQPENAVEKAILDNGICMYAICTEGENSFTYWIAGLYQGDEVPEGLELYSFPESRWAIFTARGPIPGSLQTLNTAVCGARLELMNKPGMDDPEKHLNRTGYAHIAFSVGSKEKVDALTEGLQKEGYELVSGPRTAGDGYYESCIIAIEGNQIEITE